jgi:hypothetical protein
VIHFDIRDVVGVQRARNMDAVGGCVNEYAEGNFERKRWLVGEAQSDKAAWMRPEYQTMRLRIVVQRTFRLLLV